MDPHLWKKPWSRLFKGKAIEVEEPFLEITSDHSTPKETFLEITSEEITSEEITPELTPKLYFNLITRCIEQENRVSPAQGSSVPKFNKEQCKYLAIKLQLAIQSASSIIDEINTEFLSLVEPDNKAQLLGIFKLLYATGVEVEDLIQNCSKESWIQSAIMLMNMSELITSISFNLEVCTIVFSARHMKRKVSLIHFDASRIRQVEARIVKEKADLDRAKLIMGLKNVIESNPSSSPDWQLATFLLGRLETVTLHPSSTKARFEGQILPHMVSNLKQMQDCLGRGAFGSVYKAMWLGVEVAKKTFYGPKPYDFLQEVSILDGLNHPNVVSLLWYMSNEKRCHLVMELMDGDLFTLMQQRMEENENQGCPFNIPEALDLTLQIGEGMLYLHEKRIVHRDLKSNNILIRCGKVVNEYVKYFHVKVADFGLSKTKEHSATYSNQTLNVGTTRWMAPEVMRVGNVQSDDVNEEREATLNYPFKIDVYSFGMVCYEILTGDVPFPSLRPSEVKKAVLSGDRPRLPKECPDRLKRLIEACWSAEASMRPSFGDICEQLRDLKNANLMTYWKVTISRCPSKDIATIDELVAKLSSPIADVQQRATNDICLMAGKSLDHWIYIKEEESMPLLVLMYYSRDLKTRKHAITALQALSVGDRVSISRRDSLEELSLRWSSIYISSLSKEIYLCSAIGPIVEVLKSGRMKAREKAAEALMNIFCDMADMVREKIKNSGAVPALVTLLQDGSAEGKVYAAMVLLKTCRSDEDCASAAQSRIVPPLMNVIARQSDGTMLVQALKILVNVAKVREGLVAIAAVGPTPVLVKIIASESHWNIDRAAGILHRLCLHDLRFVMETRESNVVERLAVFAKDFEVYFSYYASYARVLLQLLQEPKVDDLQLQCSSGGDTD